KPKSVAPSTGASPTFHTTPCPAATLSTYRNSIVASSNGRDPRQPNHQHQTAATRSTETSRPVSEPIQRPRAAETAIHSNPPLVDDFAGPSAVSSLWGCSYSTTVCFIPCTHPSS